MSAVVAPKSRFGGLSGGNAKAVIERGLRATMSNNYLIILSGFFEPVFYLFSLGVGLGGIIGTIDVNGTDIPYGAYIAPALLAVSAMNGAIYDSTWNVFFKLNFGKLYQTMLLTSLGPLDVARAERALDEARRVSAAQVFVWAGELAPVFGLIGTLYGFTQLAPASGAGAIAATMGAIATAVLSTLYGALLAHLLCHPLAGAIERHGLARERAREALADWFAEQIAAPPPPLRDARAHLRGVA
jgi:hypothetical protein